MTPRSKEGIHRLIRGALGEIEADLVVTNGRLVNVYSGEIIDKAEIAILDGRICYVGPSAAHARGEGSGILDARGLYVCPGFIDAHTHIGHFCRPFEYLQAYLPHGTTALMASADELATVFGYRGVKLFQDEVARHPLRVFTLISMVAPQDPALCNTQSFSQEEVREGLADTSILGLGEIVSWLRLIQGDPELLERIEMALEQKKIIHGHTSGAKDRKLCAIAAAGVSSCHEPIREEDALERLRLGYWLMLREGSYRRDIEATLKPIIDRGLNTQRLILVTDGMVPDDVAEHGHMDLVLRRAVSLGLPPMQAVQSVTLNPATYAGLDQEIGGIAPGRWADLTVVEDLRGFQVRSVLIGGKVVAQEGKSLVQAPPIAFPEDTFRCLRLKPTVSAKQFRIPCSAPRARIRVMELVNLNITAEKITDVRPKEGFVTADLSRDLLKVAVFDRHGGSGRVALGFLHGLGAKVGAVGSTACLDENTLIVVGSDDESMAVCANRLIEAGGGIAVVDHGEVVEQIDFPVGGIFSLSPWQEMATQLDGVHGRLRESGAGFTKPIYAIGFLTFVTLPSLRITDRGLVRAKDRKIVPLVVEE